MNECQRETTCRSCGGAALCDVLDLGDMPLANRLLEPGDPARDEPRFPLRVVFCASCSLVQITDTVAPDILFRDYVYFSSVSDSVLAHSQKHATDLIERRQLGADSLVVELASNDGYLLQFFQQQAVPVLGIEPAENIAAVANGKGIPTRAEFFGMELGTELRRQGLRPDVILGNNVLAHVPDLNGFVAGAAHLLAEDGIVELEFPYVVDLVDNLQFDTIYHEHLCYFSAHAIEALFRRHGLILTDVSRQPIHGGSLRVTGARQADAAGRERVDALLEEERRRQVDERDFFEAFAAQVEQLKDTLGSVLRELKGDGARIVGYGASAKGSTLLNALGIGGETLDYIVDRSPRKQGKLTPGTHLPITTPDRLVEDVPDYALLLTWNFADEILAQQERYRELGGRFILPLPTVRIVDR